MFKATFIIAALTLILSSCDRNKDKVGEPQQETDEELITTMKLIVSDSATQDSFIYSFRSQDNTSTFDTIRLKQNKTYFVTTLLLNESVSPIDTVSKEVEEESTSHQLFYIPSIGADLKVSYLDADPNGVPLGLNVKFKSGIASSGTLKTLLKHQPDSKPTSGSGDFTIGSTDVELVWPVVIND